MRGSEGAHPRSGVTTDQGDARGSGEDENLFPQSPDELAKEFYADARRIKAAAKGGGSEKYDNGYVDALESAASKIQTLGMTLEAQATTNETREAASRPSNEPPVDPVLVTLCVERADKQADAPLFDGDLFPGHNLSPRRWDRVIRAVAPLLLEAGAKRERERITRLVGAQIDSHEEHAAAAGARAGSRERACVGALSALRVNLASITEEGKGGE